MDLCGPTVSHLFNQQILREYLLRPDNFTGRKVCQLGSKGWQNNARAILQDLSSPGPKLTCCSSPPFGFPVSVNDNTRHLIAQAGKLGDISDFSLPHGPHSVIDPSHWTALWWLSDLTAVLHSPASTVGPSALAWTSVVSVLSLSPPFWTFSAPWPEALTEGKFHSAASRLKILHWFPYCSEDSVQGLVLWTKLCLSPKCTCWSPVWLFGDRVFKK